MSFPPPYSRHKDFLNALYVPGAELDVEFDNLSSTISGVLTNLSGGTAGDILVVGGPVSSTAAINVPAGLSSTRAITYTGTSIGTGSFGTITGGSGGTPGAYNNVPLSGGSGSGAIVNITVGSGGSVTAIATANSGNGSGFVVNDVVSANPSNIGGVSGFSVPITAVGGVSSAAAGMEFYENVFTGVNVSYPNNRAWGYKYIIHDRVDNRTGVLQYGWWYSYLIDSTAASGSKQAVELDMSITSVPATQQAAGLTFCTMRPTFGNSVNLTGTALAPLGGLFVLNPQLTNFSGGTYVNGMTNVEFDMANACSSAPPQYLSFHAIVLTAAHTTAAVVENNGIIFGRQDTSSPGLWSLIQDGTTSGFPMLDSTVGAVFQAKPHLGHTDCGTINMGLDFSNYLAISSYIILGPQSNGYIDGNFGIKATSLRLPALVNAANDTAAASGGVAVGQVYRNGSVLMIRVT